MSREQGGWSRARWVILPAVIAAAALIGCGGSQTPAPPKGPQAPRARSQQGNAGRQNRARGTGRQGDSGMMGGHEGMMGHGGSGMMGGSGSMMGGQATGGAQGAKAQALAPSGAHEAGQKVYARENCAACHTINGKGGTVGPNLTHIGSRLKADAIARQVRSGGGGMPAFRLSQKDLDALVDYLTSLK
jgi:cytochrome c551